ncbi:hypothetical protein JXB01_00730 [Candidatus Micrarchaeota archaeon]|nr:hypothetical protein [Candidatus Micrarchaeota archaeon]
MSEEDTNKENKGNNGPTGQILFIIALAALLIGFGAGYYMAPKETVYVDNGVTQVSEEFVPDMEKVNKIKGLMEDIAEINTGEQITFTVSEVTDEGGYIGITMSAPSYDTFVLYVSEDYEYLLGNDQTKQQVSEVETQVENYMAQLEALETQESAELEKSEKPVVKMYLMSFCPYGNQAENGIKDALVLLAEDIDFEPVYILSGSNGEYYSLHGENELNQGIREKIIYELYGSKIWVEYVYKVNNQCSLTDVETCWKGAAEGLGIDAEAVEKKYNEEFNSYADAEVSSAVYGSSPTVTINGIKYNGARTPEAYKNAICEAFLAQPDSCSSTLSEDGASASGNC